MTLTIPNRGLASQSTKTTYCINKETSTVLFFDYFILFICFPTEESSMVVVVVVGGCILTLQFQLLYPPLMSLFGLFCCSLFLSHVTLMHTASCLLWDGNITFSACVRHLFSIIERDTIKKDNGEFHIPVAY